MKTRLFFAALCIAAFISMPAQADGKKLYLYTWDTYAVPELFKKFEKETGIQVVTDIYSSNEALLAKLKAGGAYDVVAPSGNLVPLLIAENLLQKLPDDIRGLSRGLVDNVQKPGYDPGYNYVLPIFYGTTALAVNTKLTSETITSWDQFFNRPAGEKPSIGVLDDIGTTMNIASLALNKPLCDNDPATFKAIQALMLKQKPFVKVYGATGYLERLAANEIPLQMAWSGDAYRARQQNPAIKYIYPKEGVEVWVDNLAIPASAKNVDAARKFITFVMQPENAAAYTLGGGSISTLKAANNFLPDERKNAPEFNIPKGTMTGTSQACPPDVVKAYSQIWSQLTR